MAIILNFNFDRKYESQLIIFVNLVIRFLLFLFLIFLLIIYSNDDVLRIALVLRFFNIKCSAILQIDNQTQERFM